MGGELEGPGQDKGRPHSDAGERVAHNGIGPELGPSVLGEPVEGHATPRAAGWAARPASSLDGRPHTRHSDVGGTRALDTLALAVVGLTILIVCIYDVLVILMTPP